MAHPPPAGDADLGDFLLRLCHELRTPVRAMRTHAELLQRKAAAGDTSPEHQLGAITGGAIALDRLIDGLSAYSVALQTAAAPFQPVPLNSLLRAVLAKLRTDLNQHKAQVTQGEMPAVHGNPDRLMDVFELLLRNALAHRGTSPPVIEITAEEQQESWLFRVRDNGPGIEPAYLETIFRPFERLAGKRAAGPGLGLAICRAIVERHGGRIWAEPQNGGAAFVFTLRR